MAIVYRPERIRGIEVLSCTDPFEFQPHIHDRYVVWLNTAGGEHFHVSGTSDILSPGSISVIEPGVVHANRPCTETNRHLRSFYIEPDFFEHLSEQVGAKPSAGCEFSSGPMKDKQLWNQLALLHELMLGDVPDLELNARVIRTLGDFIKRHGQIRNLDRQETLRDIRIDRVLEALRETFDEPVTLDTLAELAGCTQYHLIRLFKEAKGMTPHAYLMQIRLENARRMLEQGESILDSALQSGFSDQSHLTRAFRQRYGLTPGAYRKSA